MKVSELARRVGIAPSAIRFYEAEGILPRAARTEAGYREYNEADLCRLRVVVSLRSLGLDLREAGRLATLCGDSQCDVMVADLLPRIAARRLEVANARVELDHLDAELALLEGALRRRDAIPGLAYDGGPAPVVLHLKGVSDATCDQADCCP